jgi:DNA-binding NarL/FixJ family response regulator
MNEQVIRVSIVEDNDDIRDALRALIKGSQGFECIHVYPDAETAIEDMPGWEIDVVFCAVVKKLKCTISFL